MARIRDSQKARRLLDALDAPLVMRRTSDAEGATEIQIEIVEPVDNLIDIVVRADEQDLIARYDGTKIIIEEPPEAPLPVEETVVEEPQAVPPDQPREPLVAVPPDTPLEEVTNP